MAGKSPDFYPSFVATAGGWKENTDGAGRYTRLKFAFVLMLIICGGSDRSLLNGRSLISILNAARQLVENRFLGLLR